MSTLTSTPGEVYATYETKAGGVVRWDNEHQRYVFVCAPAISGYKVGDYMPDTWERKPYNYPAKCEVRRASRG